MVKFDDIKLGQVAKISHTFTQEDIHKFVDLTGDDNRLHVDESFAAKTSFKKPVVHGMLGASFISTLIGTKLPGDGALWFSQSLEFILPVRVGDVLTIRAEVINKDERSRVIELQTDIINQDRQTVTRGKAKVQVVEPVDDSVSAISPPTNKTALVIGGSGGIGSAVCLGLAKSGFDIAIHYFNNINTANEVAGKVVGLGRKAFVFNGDISDDLAMKGMVSNVIQDLGSISVLVNCATLRTPAIKFQDLIWSDFEKHINNQIKGVFSVIRAVSPHMQEVKYGKIINITTSALEMPSANWLPYITAKGALMSFSKALAYELAPTGIRINMISPGMTETDLVSDIPERIRKVTAARTPLCRLATPYDIANAVIFLASEQSDFMCGETLRINGGQVMI